MTKLLDAVNGVATAQRALCHELHRRLGRMFHRNVVIAFDEWRNTGTFSLEQFVGELNEAHTPELIAYYDLISAQDCLIAGPEGPPGPQGDPGPEGPEGPAGPGAYPFIVYGEVEADTTILPGDTTFTQLLVVSFPINADWYYRIDYSAELYAEPDEDKEYECTVQIDAGAQTQIGFAHYKNHPYSARWNDMSSGYKVYEGTLSGTTCYVRINYRNGYGTNNGLIRRGRLLVTRVEPTP